ncbi:hypothetical protein Trydic_g7981 [Trypoxylus dichotomus]
MPVTQASILSQQQDLHEIVADYFSKVLPKPGRNYSATRRELLAVVRAVEHFHKYRLRTDHAVLIWQLRFKNLEAQVVSWIGSLH